MNISKRGDHLFAGGLRKTIGDIADSVRTQIGQYSEGRVLSNELLSLQRELEGREFDVTINRGRPVTASDAHSRAFGQVVLRFTQDMESVVSALKYRRSIDEGNQNLRSEQLIQANKQLATAKQHAMLTVGKFFDAVVDPNVLGQILACELIERTRIQIELTRMKLKLDKARRAIIDTIVKM